MLNKATINEYKLKLGNGRTCATNELHVTVH